MKLNVLGVLVGSAVLLASSAAMALPSLQLGPGTGGNWNYDTASQTWVNLADLTGSANIMAYANATAADGGNGAYAWDTAGTETQKAYLIISAVPQAIDATDLFDLSVAAQGQGALSLVSQGFGTPPINDPNSIAGHGIYDTYFEIYEFVFGGLTDIADTQPGKTGTGKGYAEKIAVTVNSFDPSVDGLHFDLFTVEGAGWDPTSANDRHLVEAFAPFSHDAEWGNVPEPATLGLFGLGLIGLGIAARRRATR